MKMRKLSIIAGSLVAILLFIVQYAGVQAGLYDEDTGTTYKEVWIDHKEFTGGCGASERPFGTWYVEPLGFNNVCQKVLDFELPNDFTNATKIEVYMDIWRGHNPPSVRFALNGRTQYASTVGLPWSRTPLIMEIPKSEFNAGANTIKVWNGTSAYHIHDIAFRLYYPAAAPLAGQTPPSAELTRVVAANGVFTPTVGGTLDIDNDQIKLVASNVSANAKFIEFHAYYEGYDEDNDGATTDWHSRAHNNCHPGGTNGSCDLPAGIGGTIDHIGTLPVTGAAAYTMTWNIPHVQGQSGVRFKLRVVSNDNNAHDATGGASAPFTLKRTKAVTVFTIPNFVDDILYADGSKPTLVERYIELPADVLTYNEAYLLGSYWKNPFFRFNTSTTKTRAFDSGESDWKISMRQISVGQLVPGTNLISYEYNGGYGQFIEKPGPMIVLRRTSGAAGTDITAPWPHRELPASGSIYIEPNVGLQVQLYDSQSGVDENSIVMTVNGVTVNPKIVGDKFNYKLAYKPTTPFALGSAVTVVVNAKDLQNNVMSPYTFAFTVRPDSQPAAVASDDFNSCLLNPSRWTFVNPTGTASYQMLGDKIAITVPAGSEQTIWTNKKTAPRIVQAITNGNFTVVVKFDSIFNLASGTEAQGLVVGNDTDFIRFDMQFDGSDIRAFLRVFENNVAISNNAKSKVLTGDTTPPAYLRIVRADPKWTFSYSTNGNTWTQLAEFNQVITVSEISAFVANGGNNPAHTGIIDYFFNTASPINPEDPTPLFLPPVTVVGNGTVNKDAECGNPVTLTAVPAPGWKFDGFTGATTSQLNPFTFSFAQGNTLTANFSQANYSLVTKAVDETGATTTGGSISATAPVNPLGYAFNEALTLTATPNQGWSFLGWSGSASGTNLTINLTAQSNMVVTGTFAQQHYALNLSVVDVNGQPISLSPSVSVTAPADPAGYIFNEIANLTVNNRPGWTFLGWSGDLTGTETNKPLTFTGAKNVTATFRQEHYALNLSVVDENGQLIANGGPSVTVSGPAAAAGYIYDETASLTVNNQPGWTFLGWSGALSGSEGSKTLTFDGAKAVTAAFRQERYALTVNVVDSNGQPITNGPTVTVPAPASAAGYVFGETINLVAVTKPGWTFVGWSGDLTGTEVTKSLTFNGAKNVTATFQQQNYTISVTVVDDKGAAADAADVTITPPASSAGYIHGEAVTIKLAPKDDWNFFSWQDGLSGNENPITFNVTGNLALKAIFTQKFTLSVRYNERDGGEVTLSPVGPYEIGQQVQVAVVVNPGWEFTGWSGGLSGNANPATITMDANKTVRANFEQIEYTLTEVVSGEGNGTVAITPDQATYQFGDEVTLTATPDVESVFARWEITPNTQSGLDLTQPTIKITISDNTTYNAIFNPKSVTPPTNKFFLPLVSN